MTNNLRMAALAIALSSTLFSTNGALAASAGEPAWGYHGGTSAEKWGDISPGFSACKLGKEQSPVDIKRSSVVKSKLDKLEFNYGATKLSIVNNGHTVQVDYDKGSYLQVGKDRYDLIQFHFHTPSEEEIDGKEYDLVAHLVHKSQDGKLAVVAVLFDRGTENAFLKTFWDKLPAESGEARSVPKLNIKLADALPTDKTYYTFMGSLTTPPCTEGVRWFILKTPVTISKEQATAFKKVYPLNNRPIQPLGARVVQEGG